MKIGAVALLGVAGVENVPSAPSRAGLLVTHGREDVIVNGPRFIQRCSLTLRDFGRQNGWPARDRDQFVGLQILFTLSRGKGGPYEMRGRVQGPTLMTD